MSASNSMISSLGVGSNLDLGSLLDSLKSSEQQRLKPLEAQKSSYTSKLSAYGILTGAVTDLQSAADKLNDASLYASTKASVSGEAVSAQTDDNAIPGNYEIKVSQLARAQSLIAAPVAKDDEAIGKGGSITIAVGDDDPVTIDLSAQDSSLKGIRDAINNSDADVSASIINDGSDTPYRLVLSANESGEDHQITITASDAEGADGTPLSDFLDYDSATASGAMIETVAAQDAELSVNGVDITRDSNTVSGAIQGVTLSLSAITDSANEVSVTRDTGTIKNAVKGFVSAYNSYQDRADKLTAFDSDENSKSGILLGDSTARSVASRLRSALNTPVAGNDLSALSDIGISLQIDGTLELDEDKLDTALAKDPRGVARLFTGQADGSDDDGVAGHVSAAIAQMTDQYGLLTSASDGIQNSIDNVNDRMDRVQDSIDHTMERYRQQFIQLDSLMSDLNSTKSYLSTQLSQLGTSSSSS